jgi:hypothetical protein
MSVSQRSPERLVLVYWRAGLLVAAAASAGVLLIAAALLAPHVADLPGPLLPAPTRTVDTAHSGPPALRALYAFVGPIVVALAYMAAAAIIGWRRTSERGPLVFSLLLLGFGDAFALGSLAPEPAHSSALVRFFVISAFSSLAVAAYLFPDGRFVPRWTRWLTLVWLYVAVTQGWFANSLVDPSGWPGPVGGAFWLPFVAVSPIAQVYRYRRVSGPIEHQQTKWVALSLSLFMLALTLYTSPLPPLPGFATQQHVFLGLLLLAALFLVPIAIGIAILRYRLWDIDVLINRTLVYGSLSLSLVALYLAGVVVLQALFRAVTGQSSNLAIAISTLAIAALFQPLRRRIQYFIDRRFYRRKYDAARTLAAFQMRVRDEVDLEFLTRDLIAVVQETMQPLQVSVWLRREETKGPH